MGLFELRFAQRDEFIVMLHGILRVKDLYVKLRDLLLDAQFTRQYLQFGNLGIDFGQPDVILGLPSIIETHRRIHAVVAAVAVLVTERYHLRADDSAVALLERAVAHILAGGEVHGGQAVGLGVLQVNL